MNPNRLDGRIGSFASFALLAAAIVMIAAFSWQLRGPLTADVHAALGGPCGDVDCSGSVSASDALAVLRRAVGTGNPLTCPDSCPANLVNALGTTLTTQPVEDGAGTTQTTGTTGTTATNGSNGTTSTTTATLPPSTARRSADEAAHRAASTIVHIYGSLEAAVCGDFDCGGTVAASDALAVLRAAVGLGAENLQCVCTGPTTTTPGPTTTTIPLGVCGDDVVNQPSEQCDGEEDDDCRSLCQLDCTCPPAVCGNDIKEIGEPCDGDDLAGESCATLGFSSGAVACTERCTGFDSEDCVLTATPPDPTDVATDIDPTTPTNIDDAVEFLYRGNPRVQVGLSPEVIDATKVAVVCGMVLDEAGAPLEGVQVRVFEHPELGRTLSRADGKYELVVNGGGVLTLSYDKDGKLPAQRPVKTPWRDFVTAEDVMLKPVDTASTAVEPNASEMQIAQAGAVTDDDGTRTATVLFPAATSAEMRMPDGSTQPLSSLTVRATEYTVGDDGETAMPGELPPTSGYTYAVELSVDEATAAGASSVTFNQAIPTYVENFIGFPVGSLVPVGAYDREQGKWIPQESGRVIKILAENGGAAELDVTGDGVADTGAVLDDLVITADELEKLAALYEPGQELWRVRSAHFSPHDYNWPYGPPPNSCSPSGCGQPPPAPKPPDKPPKGKKRCKEQGSIIECQTQVLGEEIPVAATGFTLNYRSDRLPGRKGAYTLNTRLSGADPLPPSLENIFLEIQVAGRLFKEAFTPSVNLIDTFTWDGKDLWGRTLQGRQPVLVRIGYAYTPQYYATAGEFMESYNRFGSIPTFIDTVPDMSFTTLSGRVTMPPIVLWEDFETGIGAWDARGLGLGGWSLDVHHAYDPHGRRLYLGNGETREVDSVSLLQIDTFSPASGGFTGGHDLAVAEDGRVFGVNALTETVWVAAEDGTATRFAGNGFTCVAAPCGDGGPADQASFRTPNSVSVAPDGSVYIADFNNYRIRRVGLDGIITTVAGDGTDCFSTGPCGDGGPALEAKLRPQVIAAAPDGSIYFFDYTTQRLRRLEPDGLVTSVSAQATFCDQTPKTCGEGERISETGIDVSDMVVASDGSIYFTSGTHRVLRIGVDGIIERIAGDGTQCVGSTSLCGDGADAKLAQLRDPRGITLGPDGAVYIADSGNNRVRKVGSDGIITSVVGRGAGGADSGDGGPATAAVVFSPISVAVGEDGSIYVPGNGLRKASPTLPSFDGGAILLASEDGSEAYVFDSLGRHQSTVHTLTGSVLYDFDYDLSGRLSAVTDGDGNITVIERNGSGVATAIVAQGGPRTTLAINANGLLASVANPEGETYQLTYDTGEADGLLKTFRDPKSQLYQFTYDAHGRLTQDEDPANGVTQLARTELSDDGYRVDVTTAEGLVTSYTVEDLPNGDTRRIRTDPNEADTEYLVRADGTSRVTFPDGVVVDTVLGPDPRFGMQSPVETQVTIAVPGQTPAVQTSVRTAVLSDPDNPLSLVSQTETVTLNGKTYTTVFDAGTNTNTQSTPGGRQSVFEVDEQGRPTAYTAVGNAEPMTWERDEFGRMIEVVQGAQSWTYDYADVENPFRVSSRTDALGRTMSFAYDDAQRIIETTTPGDHVLEFSYDANGNRTHVVLPGGADHTLAYSVTDLDVSYTPPGNPAGYTRQLDDDDRQIGITLPSGATQTWSYDDFGRPSGISSTDASTSVSYEQTTDTRPSLISRTAGSATQELVFSYQGPLITLMSFESLADGSYAYSYDDNFRMTGMNLTSGADEAPIAYAYDDDGLITTLGPFAVTRDAATGLPERFDDSSAQHDLTFDSRRRILTRSWVVNGQALYDEQLSYDAAGRIEQRVETVDGVESTYLYTYDDDGRLTLVRKDGANAEEYAYDDRGNRTSRKLDGGAAELSTYDLQDRQLTRGAVSYSFDVDGFIAQRGANDFFSMGNRAELLSASIGGQAVSYGYDGFNRRTAHTVGGSTSHYFYGNLDHHAQITASRSGTGVLSVYLYDEGGRILALERGGERFYVASNLLGTPILVADSTGAVVKEMEWDSFGNLVSDSNPSFELVIGFAGGLRDPLTGLIRFGVRDYEPASGRWTSRDAALFDTRQTNLFAYVDNDPVNKFDPVGLWSAGGSAYEGIGGGFRFGMTNEGFSLCAEIGIGGGDAFDYSPSGGLDDNGVSVEASVALKAGPLGNLEASAAIDDCGQMKQKRKACLGPLCTEFEKKKDQWERNGKLEVDPLGTENLLQGFKKGVGFGVEGKLAFNFCQGIRW